MAADARHRVRNRHALQRGAVKERDVADGLDVLAPVDSLQRRAVVEQRLVVVKTKIRAVVVVAVVAVVVGVGDARHRLHRVTKRHRRQLRASREHTLLYLRLQFILVRRDGHRSQRLAAASEATESQILKRIWQREVLKVHTVLKRLLPDLFHL